MKAYVPRAINSTLIYPTSSEGIQTPLRNLRKRQSLDIY